jgi:hypothetical protein
MTYEKKAIKTIEMFDPSLSPSIQKYFENILNYNLIK